MDNLFLVAVIIIVVALAGWANRRLDARPTKPKKQYLYRRKNYIMTRNEREFFYALQECFGKEYYIFPQVHLSAILDEKVKNGQNWKAAFRHINGRSVDFALCDKSSIKPLVAIELDDKSHNKRDRQARDVEVEQIFEQAKLPLARFTTTELNDRKTVQQRIEKLLVH